jgi:hypothetical protein
MWKRRTVLPTSLELHDLFSGAQKYSMPPLLSRQLSIVEENAKSRQYTTRSSDSLQIANINQDTSNNCSLHLNWTAQDGCTRFSQPESTPRYRTLRRVRTGHPEDSITENITEVSMIMILYHPRGGG